MAGSATKKVGLSLYGNLLGGGSSDGGNVISSAPVTYTLEQQAEMAKKKRDAPFGNLQPRISRPQQQQKARPKQASSSAASASAGSSHKLSSSTVTEASTLPGVRSDGATPKQQPAGKFQRTTFDDFMTNEQYDDVDYDPRKNRNAGGRNKKKKKDQGGEAKYIWSWDDVYDPAFPSKYGDFKGSDEQAKANSDWKARLYHKKITEAEKRRRNGGAYDVRDSGEAHHSHGSKSMPISFAPPPAQLNFAPPSFHDEPPRPLPDNDDDDDDPYANLGRAAETVAAAPPKFAPSLAPDEAASYDNPSLRRLGMNSSESSDVQPSIPLQQAPQIPLIAVRPGTPMSEAEKAAKMADAKLKIEALKKKFAARQAEDIPKAASPTRQLAASTPPAMAQSFPPLPPSQDAQDSGTISRAPVRYSDVPKAEQPEEGLRTRAPGQKGFAQRILEKQGWQKGQGLGAKGQGITTAIVAQAQKRKKRPDAEGGGWAVPANMGRLVGGKKAKIDSAISDEPLPSRVVKYSGLLDGLNATEEISENELYQRIGEDMNEKFGTVERIFVWLASDNEVFVKFTDGMGALRATTNEFSFKGNACTGQYFSEDKFEEGEYA